MKTGSMNKNASNVLDHEESQVHNTTLQMMKTKSMAGWVYCPPFTAAIHRWWRRTWRWPSAVTDRTGKASRSCSSNPGPYTLYSNVWLQLGHKNLITVFWSKKIRNITQSTRLFKIFFLAKRRQLRSSVCNVVSRSHGRYFQKATAT